jgi:DNA-binding MarR family transcriptional regulator
MKAIYRRIQALAPREWRRKDQQQLRKESLDYLEEQMKNFISTKDKRTAYGILKNITSCSYLTPQDVVQILSTLSDHGYYPPATRKKQ